MTRSYLTVLFARAQEGVARATVERLTSAYQAIRDQVEGGARDVTESDVSQARVYLRLAETKQVQAAKGIRRALTALKEAIGLECDARLDVPPGRLGEPGVRPVRDEIVARALERRAKRIQADLFARIVCLEFEARGTAPHRKRTETFAAGSDIHAQVVPQGLRTENVFQPGAPPRKCRGCWSAPGATGSNTPSRSRHAPWRSASSPGT